MTAIIPTPKKTEERNGFFDISGTFVTVSSDTDHRVRRAAARLAKEMSMASGEMIPLTSFRNTEKCVKITTGREDSEGYTLTVDENCVTVSGKSPAGAFYGIQSLRQLVMKYGVRIPCLYIEDEPDFKVRGFYQDITRGRVNKPEKLRDIADMLALYKINSLQLYVEDAFMFKEFEGVLTADETLSSEEILDFDEYCYNNFIELVPSLSTFGHLFTLLQSEKYNYISELPGYEMKRNYWMDKQWHHTVNVYHPDTVKVIGSMIEQYISLFRTDKFNICCDETLDLCNGVNKGRDKKEAFFHHAKQLYDIVKSHGKKVMMWCDECMQHPEMIRECGMEDVTVLTWCYRKNVPEWLPGAATEHGYTQILCPGTSSWSHFIEDIDTSVGNITDMATAGKRVGTLGILNTNWGDFGHICQFNCNLYGTLFGAEKSWNADSPADEEFKAEASRKLYGETGFSMVDTIAALTKAEKSADWFRFVMWHSANCLEGRQSELEYSEDGCLNENDAKESIAICDRELEKLYSLGRSDAKITDVILAARAIKLMNREYLYVNEVPGYTDKECLQNDFNEWLTEYEAAWLRDDKPSQLWRISEFIRNITNVPTGRKNV